MKFKLLKCLILITLFSINNFAQAGLITKDLSEKNDALITYDDVNLIEWLDLTETNNYSVSQISAMLLDQDSLLYGWEYASFSELSALYSQFDFDDHTDVVKSYALGESFRRNVNDFSSLFGNTTDEYWNNYEGVSGYILENEKVRRYSAFYKESDLSAWNQTNFGIVGSMTDSSVFSGHYLIKKQAQPAKMQNQIASVPEPSSLAILALGIMGLVSRKFNKAT